MRLSFLDVVKSVHFSRYTRYCLVVPVLHDSKNISQAHFEIFFCRSLVRTRDMPSLEVWAITGGAWSCCVTAVEEIPPWVEVLAG